jgi:hypothetical protein
MSSLDQMQIPDNDDRINLLRVLTHASLQLLISATYFLQWKKSLFISATYVLQWKESLLISGT